MRLHSRTGCAALVHNGQRYVPGDDGAFELPDHVAREVHSFHVSKVPLWETDVERQQRMIREETDRRRDPSAQYEILDRIMKASERGPDPADEIAALKARLAELEADRAPDAPRTAPRRAAAKPKD